MLVPWKKSYDQPRQCIKKQKHCSANKGPYSPKYGFSSSHVWMWELGHKEGWVLRTWHFWIVLEKTLGSRLDSKEINPVNPKVNQSSIVTGRTDAEVEASILWPPDAKRWLMRTDPDGEKDWEGSDRGLDCWMASYTQWIWVWANSRRWWRTGKPDMLQFMGLQRVRHDLVTVHNNIRRKK